jgi:gluconate 5-dehydrogenase
MPGLFDLGGRVALVTGSTRGLGAVLAAGLGRAGATVVCNGRSGEAVEARVAALRAAGLDAHGAAFDVTDEQAVEAGVRRIEDEVGPLEIVVNNAGAQHRRPLLEFSLEAWRALVDVNLTSAFLVSRAAGRGMVARGHGKIVNVASLQSAVARPTIAPYGATKGGLLMLTRGLCADLAPHGIQVNAIGPGYFATELTAPLRADAAFDAWLCQRTPAGRWGEPEELVGTLVYLASDASSFVNGQIVYVDGGVLAVL